MKPTGSLGILTAAAALAVSTVVEAQTRAPGEFTLEEIVSVSSLTDGGVPTWAPDGTGLVVRGRDTLWSAGLSGGAPEALPLRGASRVAFSSDGKWMGYVAGSGRAQDLWLWSVADRRARRLTHLGAWISSWSWAPDGRRIAFAAALRGNPDIYTVDVPNGDVQRLSGDSQYDVYPTWTPDGRTIVFVRLNESWVDHDVIAMNAADGSGSRVIVRDTDFFDYRRGQEFGPAQVSPRGDLVLFRSHRSGWLNWWLVPMEGGEPRPLAPEPADQNAQKPFRGYAQWSPDGGTVAYTSNLNGTGVLRIIGVDGGEPRTLVAPEVGVVANHTWSPDGRSIAYTLDTPRHPTDLFVVGVNDGKVSRLTRSVADSSLHDALFASEKVSYPSSDGLTIHAYLFRPASPPPPNGHPAIVWIHGGPTSQFDDSWRRQWESHYFVKHGYAVLLPNVRGSSGYGLDFEKLSENCWGRCDMEDVVAGVEFLRTLPEVNADRVAATGTSYGGFMSMAASVFAPGVFRAAVPTRSGYGDWLWAVEEYFAEAEIKLLEFELGPLDTSREVYRRSSPSFYAAEVDTPLLVIGTKENRPMRRFVDEVARYYKPVRYRAIENIGSGASRLIWMPEMLEFLDRHVRGKVGIRTGS